MISGKGNSIFPTPKIALSIGPENMAIGEFFQVARKKTLDDDQLINLEEIFTKREGRVKYEWSVGMETENMNMSDLY